MYLPMSLPLYLVSAAIWSPNFYLPQSTKHVLYKNLSATLITFLEVTTATHV
jgi:hypothetical protein